MRYAILSATGFGLLAGVTRLFLQGVQTRTQILVFCIVVAIWETWARPRLGHPVSIRSLALGIAAVGIAALLAKWYVELVWIPRQLQGP